MLEGSVFHGVEAGDNTTNFLNIDESEYYSYENFKSVLSKSNSGEITVMYANIGSLPRHINDLNDTLTMLNFSPDIIGLSETRITQRVNKHYKPHIDNYKYYPSLPSSTDAGSAGVFIKSSLDVTIRNDLDISIPGLFETIWFDIEHKHGGKKALLG